MILIDLCGPYEDNDYLDQQMETVENQEVKQEVKVEKGNKRFFLIRLGLFLSGLSVFAQLYLFQPLLPEVSSEFHISLGYSSFLVSSSTLGMALGLFYFAFNADQFSRKGIMVFALISSAVLTLLSIPIQSIPLFALVGVLKGFAVSGVSAVALAYIIEEIKTSSVLMAIGFYMSGNIIGGMTGRIFATLIAGFWGWRMAILGIGLESLILGLIFWKIFPSSRGFIPLKRVFEDKMKQMKGFVKDSYLLSLFFLAAILMGLFVSIYNYISFRLKNPPFELKSYVVAFVFVMYIFGAVGTMLTSQLSQRFTPSAILKANLFLMAMGIFLMALSSLIFVIVGIALMTFAFFVLHTTASRMAVSHAKEGKSSATSIYWLFYYMGSTVLGSGTGYLLHATSWSVFIGILILFLTLAYWLTYRLGKMTRASL